MCYSMCSSVYLCCLWYCLAVMKQIFPRVFVPFSCSSFCFCRCFEMYEFYNLQQGHSHSPLLLTEIGKMMIHLCECIYSAAKPNWQYNLKRDIMCTSCPSLMTFLGFKFKERCSFLFEYENNTTSNVAPNLENRFCAAVWHLLTLMRLCSDAPTERLSSAIIPSSYDFFLVQMAFTAPVLLVLKKKSGPSGSLSLAQTPG